MLTGIALLTVITASLGSWFVEKVAEVKAAEPRTEAEVSDLAAELRALRRDIAALGRDRSEGGPPGVSHRAGSFASGPPVPALLSLRWAYTVAAAGAPAGRRSHEPSTGTGGISGTEIAYPVCRDWGSDR